MNRCLISLLLFFASCHQPEREDTASRSEQQQVRPAPNTVVVSDRMRIADPLNELYFSVEVVTTAEQSKGVYEVLVTYGHNEASTRITMPDADEPLLPKLRRGAAENTYIIGFTHGRDTSFNDYFLIKGDNDKTEMKYIKAYSFR